MLFRFEDRTFAFIDFSFENMLLFWCSGLLNAGVDEDALLFFSLSSSLLFSSLILLSSLMVCYNFLAAAAAASAYWVYFKWISWAMKWLLSSFSRLYDPFASALINDRDSHSVVSSSASLTTSSSDGT